jgi:hypothetical protein
VKRCSECAREIDDSATMCEGCAAWVAAVLPAFADLPLEPSLAPEPASVPEPSTVVTPVASSTGLRGGREVLLAVVAVTGAALGTFALLAMRGGPSANVSAAAAVPSTRPASAAASTPLVLHKWSTDNRGYWIGNQRHAAAFELQADDLVKTWFGPVRPTLVVRCTARRMQTFVYTGSPMKIEPNADGKTVRVSMDDEPMRTERWPDSDDHDALFAPDGTAFTQRLLRARTLRFGYSPHNSDDVVAQFHVSGLAELIDPVAKECGWGK